MFKEHIPRKIIQKQNATAFSIIYFVVCVFYFLVCFGTGFCLFAWLVCWRSRLSLIRHNFCEARLFFWDVQRVFSLYICMYIYVMHCANDKYHAAVLFIYILRNLSHGVSAHVGLSSPCIRFSFHLAFVFLFIHQIMELNVCLFIKNECLTKSYVCQSMFDAQFKNRHTYSRCPSRRRIISNIIHEEKIYEEKEKKKYMKSEEKQSYFSDLIECHGEDSVDWPCLTTNGQCKDVLFNCKNAIIV